MDQQSKPTSTTGDASPVMNGIRGRCPRCGDGKLFSGYLKVADQCDVCGLGLHGHDTGDGPVVPILLLIGGIIVGLALWLELTYEPAVWVHLALWFPLSTILILGTLPRIKGMAVGLQFKYRSTEEEGKLGGI